MVLCVMTLIYYYSISKPITSTWYKSTHIVSYCFLSIFAVSSLLAVFTFFVVPLKSEYFPCVFFLTKFTYLFGYFVVYGGMVPTGSLALILFTKLFIIARKHARQIQTSEESSVSTESKVFIKYLIYTIYIVLCWAIILLLIQLGFSYPNSVPNDVVSNLFLFLQSVSTFYPTGFILCNVSFRQDVIKILRHNSCVLK